MLSVFVDELSARAHFLFRQRLPDAIGICLFASVALRSVEEGLIRTSSVRNTSRALGDARRLKFTPSSERSVS